MTWERTFGTHAVSHRSTLADPLLAAAVRDALMFQVIRILWEHGWSHEWLRRAGAPQITLTLTDSHQDYFYRNQVAIRAECRALDLLNPNPLPDMSLWRRRRW